MTTKFLHVRSYTFFKFIEDKDGGSLLDDNCKRQSEKYVYKYINSNKTYMLKSETREGGVGHNETFITSG